MISHLKIRNFKSLKEVDLKLGHFNLLIGANASGKSNFLDALRFLQGVGNGFTIDEILDGKPQSAISVKWDGIRGGSQYVAFRERDGFSANEVEFRVGIPESELYGLKKTGLTYELTFWPGSDKFRKRITDEVEQRVWTENESIRNLLELRASGGLHATFFNTAREYSRLLLQKDADVTAQGTAINTVARPEDFNLDPYSIFVAHVLSALADIHFIDPFPEFMRGYSKAQSQAGLGEQGEGFASLIHEIERSGDKPALLEWLKELRPDEVDDIYALQGLNNDYMVAIKEGNIEFRAPVLSDGTLRFIALAAAFFQPSMPKVLVLEEIEKGLHPTRLRLLLDLMRSQSKRTGTQVFATTHSPTLLAWLNEEDRKTAFICTRDEESGATKIRSLPEVPRLDELIGKGYHIDNLFQQGWMESVLYEL